MEPLLTLVLALGGIATGVGVIWTAVVTRHLARATEQSVAEQSQILREQKEHARLSLELDLTCKLAERWNSRLFQDLRIRSLVHVKEHYFKGDDISEVDYLDPASAQVFNFFEHVAYLMRTGVLLLETVYSEYGAITMAWSLWEPAVKKAREKWNAPDLYEDMEYAYRQMTDLSDAIASHPNTRVCAMLCQVVTVDVPENSF
jgi:cell division protein FtsL